jgi:hypothetical protein
MCVDDFGGKLSCNEIAREERCKQATGGLLKSPEGLNINCWFNGMWASGSLKRNQAVLEKSINDSSVAAIGY